MIENRRVIVTSVFLVCQLGQATGRSAQPIHAEKAGASPAAKGKAVQGSASIFVGCGFLLVENHGKASFTVLLKADQARQIPHETSSLWVLDDVLVEVVTTDAKAVGAPGARGAELLKKHMAWEVAYLAGQHRWPTLHPSGNSVDLGLRNVVTMLWGFDAPVPFDVFGQRVARVAYITAAVDDVVFVMSASMRDNDDPRLVGRVFRKSMATLRKAGHPVDAVAIAAEVKSGPQPWKGCASGGTDEAPSR